MICSGCVQVAPSAEPPLRQSAAAASNRSQGEFHYFSTSDRQKKSNLLYVANGQNNTVTFYSLPKRDLVGTISVQSPAYGLCTDKRGNVYIPDFFNQHILEFAHGALMPRKTLSDDGSPFACAVDPTTGNLAVTNYCDGPVGSCTGHGTVLIYINATGNAEVFHDTLGGYMAYCSYDRLGNLFVDGEARFFHPSFAEMPNGSSTFRQIALKLPQRPQSPGFMQWVSNTLYVAAVNASTIYAYRLKHARAERIGAIELDGMSALEGTNQFLIVGSKVIAPSLVTPRRPSGAVEFYHFPSGGSPTARIVNSVDLPEAVVLSRGS
jgi:hypothetical protein